MTAFFRRGKGLDDFIDGIRPELEALSTPPPTEALKTRILTSRSAGVRLILPAPDERRRGIPLSVAIAVAAVLVLVLIPVELHRSATVGDDIVSPGVFGHLVFAEEVPRRNGPNIPPALVSGGSKLHPLSLEFESRFTDSTRRVAKLSHISFQVSNTSLDNTAAWRIVSLHRDSMPSARVDAETVYVAQRDLHLLKREIHVAPYGRYGRINVTQQFRRDSVIGHMTTEGPSIGAGRSFARKLPGAFAPFISERIAPVFFMGVPLRREWSGSVTLLGWAVRDNDVLYPVEVRVESEDTVTVPAGRFDCWRMSIRFNGRSVDYWVRKSDGLGIRVFDRSDTKTKGTHETVLTRIK